VAPLSLRKLVNLALVLVASSSLAVLGTYLWFLARAEAEAAFLRLASQQQVLAQHLFVLSTLVGDGKDPLPAAALRDAAAAFEQRMGVLEHGERVGSLAVAGRQDGPGEPLDRLRVQWDEVRRPLAGAQRDGSRPDHGLAALLSVLVERSTDVVLAQERRADARRARMRAALLPLCGLAAASWAGGLLLMRRHLLEPVARLEAGVRAIERGNLEPRLTASGALELRTLARALEEMALSLRRSLEQHQRSEQALGALTGRLLRLQDEERRRIARDLHDGTVQTLAALGMNLAVVRRALREEPALAALAECEALVESCSRELRTLSHLLHPPLLEEVGLTAALNWLGKRFAQGTGIQVDLRVAPQLGRLQRDDETALFRVIQECFNNIHRHSGGSRAWVRVWADASRVFAVVRDDGKGMAGEGADREVGVGVAGMRERLRQLGGALDFPRCSRGTTVRGVLPLRRLA
jgi:signal transduction histidine kinase